MPVVVTSCPSDESVCSGGLNRRSGRGGGATTGSSETRSARDVSKLRGARDGDDGKRAVIAGDADSRDGYELCGGKTVRDRCGDGNEKTIFGCTGGAGGDGNSCGLRSTVGTGGDGDNHVFVDDGWPGAGTALADAIEIGVVELARQIVARFSVADGQIFPAEECCGIRVSVGRETGGNAGERAGSGLFIEDTVGVEQHGAQSGIQCFVGLDVVDGGIPGERPEERLQTGPRSHAAVAENHVLTIRRDAVRQVGWRHVCHQPAEDFDRCVE